MFVSDFLSQPYSLHLSPNHSLYSKSLQLAKLFGNFLEGNGQQGFVLKTPDSSPFAWSVSCDANDTVQVCYQRSFEQHRKSSAATAPSSSRRSSAPSMMANTVLQAQAQQGSQGSRRSSAPLMQTTQSQGVTYGLMVDGVGPVSGVPSSALRNIQTKQPLGDIVNLGMQVEIDFKTHWTIGVITEISQPQSTTTPDTPVYYEDDDDMTVNDMTGGNGGGDVGVISQSLSQTELTSEDAELVDVNDHFGGLMSFEEFKDSLMSGIEVVKFNRRGQAAFRTITLIGDHTLTWMSPKDALKEMSDAKKSKGNFDLRELISVRPGEVKDPESKTGDETGTATLRMYAKKHDDGKEMQATGHCLSLIFPGRSVDIATDSVAHRDHLLNGFRLLAQRGPSGGKLLSVELNIKSKTVGFTVKTEVKSSGVVELVCCVHTVVQGSEADKAHLKAGDRIYQINGQQQNKWLSNNNSRTPAKFSSLIQLKLNKLSNLKKPLEIVVERLDLDRHLAATEAGMMDL